MEEIKYFVSYSYLHDLTSKSITRTNTSITLFSGWSVEDAVNALVYNHGSEVFAVVIDFMMEMR